MTRDDLAKLQKCSSAADRLSHCSTIKTLSNSALVTLRILPSFNCHPMMHYLAQSSSIPATSPRQVTTSATYLRNKRQNHGLWTWFILIILDVHALNVPWYWYRISSSYILNKSNIPEFRAREQLAKVNITEPQLLSDAVKFSDTVSDLGVVVDRELTMSNQVAALSRSCFYQLLQLRAVRNSLDIVAIKTLVNLFVVSRLDNCIILLAGITDSLLSKLQRDLRWLPVKSRIDFKVATIVWKCLRASSWRGTSTTLPGWVRCAQVDASWSGAFAFCRPLQDAWASSEHQLWFAVVCCKWSFHMEQSIGRPVGITL